VLSTVIVVTFNADSITAARELANNAALRTALAADAEALAHAPPSQLTSLVAIQQAVAPAAKADKADTGSIRIPVDSMQIAQMRFALTRRLIDSLGSRGLPIGWPPVPASETAEWYGPMMYRARLGLAHLPGLLLTIVAVSLGAPFWFDMLNKVVNIRAAGRAPEEKPKSPEALPLAR
jgi:hypothetical protein